MTGLPLPRPGRRLGAPGVPYLVAGIAVFSVQDLILKLLSGTYPLSEAMVLRSLTAFPLLLVLVRLSGGYATLFITVFSVLLLREPVGPRHWAAVAVGFGGVLVMLRPGTDLFDWAALLALFSGLSYALSMIAARYLGPTETAAALAFWGNVVFLGCAVLMAVLFGHGAFAAEIHPSLGFLFRGWVTPTARDLMLMMACGAITAAGLTLLTQAYRVSASAIVAPFEYTAMLWGVVWGWLFWRDWPDAAGWSGIVVIVGAGLYVLYREAPTAPRRT